MSDYKNCEWCGSSFKWKYGGHDHCSERCKQEHQNSKRNSSSSGGGCFVATSVYGNYDHPTVLDLRGFRDNWLDKRENGKKFIRWYYQKGPILASWIDNSKTRKLLAFSFIVKPLHFIIKLFRLHK